MNRIRQRQEKIKIILYHFAELKLYHPSYLKVRSLNPRPFQETSINSGLLMSKTTSYCTLVLGWRAGAIFRRAYEAERKALEGVWREARLKQVGRSATKNKIYPIVGVSPCAHFHPLAWNTKKIKLAPVPPQDSTTLTSGATSSIFRLIKKRRLCSDLLLITQEAARDRIGLIEVKMVKSTVCPSLYWYIF